mgnify:CR=1 FL=1
MYNKIYEKIKDFIKNNLKGLIILAIIVFLCFYKTPYVIYTPGGSINLNNRVSIENENNISGNYYMSYVSVIKANIPTIVLSLFVPNWDIYNEQDLTDMDYDTLLKIEQIDLKNSIYLASLNAYTKVGKKIDVTNEIPYVTLISEESNTNLQPLDEIITIDGNKFTKLENFQDYISTLNIGDKVSFTIKRSGKELNKYAYVTEIDGVKKIGVGIVTAYEFESSPKLEMKTKSSEAGSSGGLMLSLEIYDKLNEKDLSHGKKIMGTGTIDETGNVGQIGGIKYKLFGAENDGADIFFVPKDNYEEAKKVYKKNNLSFDLVMVETFDDAVNYLNSL